MNGGVKNWLVALSFTAASCASAPNGVEIRPIADPGSKLRPGADRLADAKGQLALGNVGLALEGFRRASREFPDDAEAFAGMAACYELMRRYDLAESSYQAALAVAPRDTRLLARLAGTLEQEGKAGQAAEVRGEIAQLQSASAALDTAAAEPEAPLPPIAAPVQSVTVALPPATLAPTNTTVLPVADLRPAPVAVEERLAAAPQAVRIAEPVAVRAESKLPAPMLNDRMRANILAGLASGLTPLSIGPLAAMLSAPSEPPAPRIPAPRLDDRSKVSVAANTPAPRLERLSLGEVALLTDAGSVWRGQVVARTPQKVTVKWVPLTTAAVRPNIRLLNAARVQGLAARNRDYLVGRGWRKIEIGDASATRDRSLVLYPMLRPQLGRSLAAQFGFRAQPTGSSDAFVVLLGRDAVAVRAAQIRG